jgi:hypothetical protein
MLAQNFHPRGDFCSIAGSMTSLYNNTQKNTKNTMKERIHAASRSHSDWGIEPVMSTSQLALAVVADDDSSVNGGAL